MKLFTRSPHPAGGVLRDAITVRVTDAGYEPDTVVVPAERRARIVSIDERHGDPRRAVRRSPERDAEHRTRSRTPTPRARRGMTAMDSGANARGEISTRRHWAALGAISLVSLLLLLQDTAVSVVLPAVRHDLRLSLTSLEWVVNAYAVAVAALTLASGRLADAHGRRRLFLIGLAVFGAGSLLAGLAAQDWIMILARAVQGTGGALAGPAALAIIWSMFGPGERGAAVGL